MRVLIVGAGQVGFQLAKRLSEEDQDVVLIDLDPEKTTYVSEQLDLLDRVADRLSTIDLRSAGRRRSRGWQVRVAQGSYWHRVRSASGNS